MTDFKDAFFTVVVIDGHYSTEDQLGQDSLVYEGLQWKEAVELIKLGFMQGFEAVIWKMDDE